MAKKVQLGGVVTAVVWLVSHSAQAACEDGRLQMMAEDQFELKLSSGGALLPYSVAKNGVKRYFTCIDGRNGGVFQAVSGLETMPDPDALIFQPAVGARPPQELSVQQPKSDSHIRDLVVRGADGLVISIAAGSGGRWVWRGGRTQSASSQRQAEDHNGDPAAALCDTPEGFKSNFGRDYKEVPRAVNATLDIEIEEQPNEDLGGKVEAVIKQKKLGPKLSPPNPGDQWTIDENLYCLSKILSDDEDSRLQKNDINKNTLEQDMRSTENSIDEDLFKLGRGQIDIASLSSRIIDGRTFSAEKKARRNQYYASIEKAKDHHQSALEARGKYGVFLGWVDFDSSQVPIFETRKELEHAIAKSATDTFSPQRRVGGDAIKKFGSVEIVPGVGGHYSESVGNSGSGASRVSLIRTYAVQLIHFRPHGQASNIGRGGTAQLSSSVIHIQKNGDTGAGNIPQDVSRKLRQALTAAESRNKQNDDMKARISAEFKAWHGRANIFLSELDREIASVESELISTERALDAKEGSLEKLRGEMQVKVDKLEKARLAYEQASIEGLKFTSVATSTEKMGVHEVDDHVMRRIVHDKVPGMVMVQAPIRSVMVSHSNGDAVSFTDAQSRSSAKKLSTIEVYTGVTAWPGDNEGTLALKALVKVSGTKRPEGEAPTPKNYREELQKTWEALRNVIDASKADRDRAQGPASKPQQTGVPDHSPSLGGKTGGLSPKPEGGTETARAPVPGLLSSPRPRPKTGGEPGGSGGGKGAPLGAVCRKGEGYDVSVGALVFSLSSVERTSDSKLQEVRMGFRRPADIVQSGFRLPSRSEVEELVQCLTNLGRSDLHGRYVYVSPDDHLPKYLLPAASVGSDGRVEANVVGIERGELSALVLVRGR